MYYNQAKYLKESVEVLVKEVNMDYLTDSEKEYERWKTRLLLLCFAPYVYDGAGYRIEYTYNADYDCVDEVVIDENNDYEIVEENEIVLDDFINEDRSRVVMHIPSTRDLMGWLEYDRDILS